MQIASQAIQLTEEKRDLHRCLIPENRNETRKITSSRFQERNHQINDPNSTTIHDQNYERFHRVIKILNSLSVFNQVKSTLTIAHDLSLQIKEKLQFEYKKKMTRN